MQDEILPVRDCHGFGARLFGVHFYSVAAVIVSPRSAATAHDPLSDLQWNDRLNRPVTELAGHIATEAARGA
jgi:hypothetical protein